MKPKIGVETSITRFVHSGLSTYARSLVGALEASERVELVPLAIPTWFAGAPHPGLQKVLAAYWQIWHARVVVPLAARRQRCDLVHYTTPMPIAGNLRCPSVATVHDLIPFVHPEWVQPVRGWRMRHGIRQTVERADHLIADSDATKRDVLQRFHRPAGSVTTVLLAPNAQLGPIDDDDARRIVEQHYGLGTGYILCVGSIEPRKNLERVLAAYARLKHKRSSIARLAIVGGSVWRHEHLRRTVERLQIASHVVFTGHVPAGHLAALFRCAGVFVYPSLYEGFGLPPLEAMQARCPVITSNTSSLPEVVGPAAITVDPYDIDQLAGAIELVLTDRTLADELRERGVERVAHFSWQRCAAETLAVYERVLGG